MNPIRKIITETYQKTITDGPYNSELKRSLRVHERVPVFFDNLTRELSKPGFNPTREQIELATRDLTHVFIRAVHMKAEERVMSPLKKAMAKAAKSRADEMKRLVIAIEKQGEENEQITEDKKGETSRSVVNVEKAARGS